MRHLIAVLSLVGFATAAPVPKSLKKADEKSLIVGTWKTTSEGGKTGKDINTHTYHFGDEGVVRQEFGQGQESNWEWAIDPTQTPKRMTWVNRKNSKDCYHCAYELDGDVLRLNCSSANSPMPMGVGPKGGGYAIEMTRDTSAK
jgi:uncharacterized protein (TIGR03067 family)